MSTAELGGVEAVGCVEGKAATDFKTIRINWRAGLKSAGWKSHQSKHRMPQRGAGTAAQSGD